MPATMQTWGATLTVMVGGVDVSCDVVEIDVQRGKTNLWDRIGTGTCLVVLDASDRGQPPSRGPLGASVSVAVSYGLSARTIFTGTVQQRRLESTPEHTFINLDCMDAMERLGRVFRHANTGDTAALGSGGETVTARIARWLDIANFTGTRNLDPSPFTCPEIIIGANNASVLANIQATAMADGGDFFIDGNGAATFKSWNWRTTAMPYDAIFSDQKSFDWVCYSSSVLRDDLDEVWNHVEGSRRKWDATNPVKQIASNSSSVSTYGERAQGSLNDLELLSDPQVAQRVANVVTAGGGPSPRFDPVVVQPGADPARGWPKVLNVHWGSKVTVNRKWPNGRVDPYDGHVIGERWRINANDATITYRLSGTATWSAITPPTAPIFGIVTPDGRFCVPQGYPCNNTCDVVVLDANNVEIARFLPGSLCYCETGGGIQLPSGTAQVGYDCDGTVVTTPVNPNANAIFWYDVLNLGPNMVERVDGDQVNAGAFPGWGGTRAGQIPGGFDAIDANSTGGIIGAAHSTKVEQTNFDGGWTIDFWFFLTQHLGANTEVVIVTLDTIQVLLTTKYQTTGPYITEMEVAVVGTDVRPAPAGGGHNIFHSGALAQLVPGSWDHWVISWDPAVGSTGQGGLSISRNGTPL